MTGTPMYRPRHHVRFVTASSLFDGHDVSINIMRRLLQSGGAEVIHLGHNRSVEEVVVAAIQEDVQGIAVSSYQGGHMEYFKYMYDLLQEKGAGYIRIYGGGGGVILPREIKELENYGIARIFSPDDGRKLGLQGMISQMLAECDFLTVPKTVNLWKAVQAGEDKAIGQLITWIEAHYNQSEAISSLFSQIVKSKHPASPVLGITGTGGAGKSSLTDELILRLLQTYSNKKVAVLSIDPTKQKTGGALLGDRIRMNAIHSPRVYMRSLATRGSRSELSEAIRECLAVIKEAPFDLIIIETSGIGQGNADIVDVADLSLYVMTSEFGAPSQLEKIDMIDLADLIVINKFDRKGSEDALREVRKAYQRSHGLFSEELEQMPVYGTMANQFNDEGTNQLFQILMRLLDEKGFTGWQSPINQELVVKQKSVIIPSERSQYLNEIVQTVRVYQAFVENEIHKARRAYQLEGALSALKMESSSTSEMEAALEVIFQKGKKELHPESQAILSGWEEQKARYRQKEWGIGQKNKEIKNELTTKSLSGIDIPKVVLPHFHDWGDILRWVYLENVPGSFPYTAGVFPFKRKGEDPKRQFAGEGTPERTNRRFHYLSKDDEAKRLSTAFDSVTLYGEDPDTRPDIYGKIGESGVSVCSLDDMKKLYQGFDLCAPKTSVSMTINGPAPILLAMFLNTALDQQYARFEAEQGRKPTKAEAEEVKERTFLTVRGTVQADILKEDQGQNTCIFSTEFALRMMGDIQEYFIQNQIRHYYSVSISGYHIAEAGANPISQLAFTLANGFTYVEYFLSRGMAIDDFAPNLSFFFSNGLDPEYTVIGRVARRIWAIVMKKKYHASERSQKLKYHIQTSGRSLHAQEMNFNDIRTTLQALMAFYDNCNSLHTNSFDEAITTPSEESVRRAMAIQLIITKELGWAKNENPLQGSFFIEELTDLVEEAVLAEFERINTRGGVLGAMEMQYQRGKIQDESMYYEMKKHSGELPIIGVNTYLNPRPVESLEPDVKLARATKEEKDSQIRHVKCFQQRHEVESQTALERLKQVALKGENIFAELMNTVKVASLGQITGALYEVGGKYRRNM